MTIDKSACLPQPTLLESTIRW